MNSARPLISLLASVVAVAAFGAAPATTQSAKAKKGKDPAIAAVESATAVLSKEYQSFLADPSKASTRSKSDYFVKDAKGVTPEAVLDALSTRRLPDDPRVAAYVGWQLLSAVPDRVEGQSAAKVAVALQNAPRPRDVFGLSVSEQMQLKMMVNRARSDSELAPTNDKISDAIEKSRADSASIIAYRDALASRLPPSADGYAVRLDDLIVRAQVGAEVAPSVKQLASSIRAWSATDARAADRQAVIAALKRAAGQRLPEYITGFTWDDKHFTSKPTIVKEPLRTLKTLADEISKDHGDGTGGLGFKDEKSGSKSK